MRILLIEDEVALSEALKEILNSQSYMVDVVHNGREGYGYAKDGIYDAIVLDIMLPEMDGFEIARKLREDNVKTPILMLTAKDSIDDRVKGLDCGADDYMVKPFAFEEFLARVRAVTRRKGEVIMNGIQYKDIFLDLERRTINKGEKSIRLNFKEYEIFKLFLLNDNQIFSKEDIIVKIWGYESDASDNNVEAYISFIRRKLKHLNSEVNIEAIRKVGYRLC